MNKTIVLFDYLIRSLNELIARPDTDMDLDKTARGILSVLTQQKQIYLEEKSTQPAQQPMAQQPMNQPAQPQINPRQQAILAGKEQGGY